MSKLTAKKIHALAHPCLLWRRPISYCARFAQLFGFAHHRFVPISRKDYPQVKFPRQYFPSDFSPKSSFIMFSICFEIACNQFTKGGKSDLGEIYSRNVGMWAITLWMKYNYTSEYLVFSLIHFIQSRIYFAFSKIDIFCSQ